MFTITIFHIIFDSLLFVSLPNTWKWAKNEPKMATVNNPKWMMMGLRPHFIIGLFTAWVAILGPFLAHFHVFGRETNKREWKWCEKWLPWTPYPVQKGKWCENAFFSPGTLPKRWKMILFWVHFCNSKVRVPFFIHFSSILSFNFENNGNKMKWKMIQKWFKNGPKMATVNNPNVNIKAN